MNYLEEWGRERREEILFLEKDTPSILNEAIAESNPRDFSTFFWDAESGLLIAFTVVFIKLV